MARRNERVSLRSLTGPGGLPQTRAGPASRQGNFQTPPYRTAAPCSSYNEDMLRVTPLILVAAATFAQTPPATPGQAPPPASPQAPPEVDAALRARVSQFYQLEVAGKFNQALQLVAEDTKDLFVGSSKPIYRSYEIQDIRYSDDFTTARLVVLVLSLIHI